MKKSAEVGVASEMDSFLEEGKPPAEGGTCSSPEDDERPHCIECESAHIGKKNVVLQETKVVKSIAPLSVPQMSIFDQ